MVTINPNTVLNPTKSVRFCTHPRELGLIYARVKILYLHYKRVLWFLAVDEGTEVELGIERVLDDWRARRLTVPFQIHVGIST